MTPLDEIDTYAALKSVFEEITSMDASEIYNLEALTRRCAEIAADTPRLVNITLARIRTEAAFTLKEMVGTGRLPPEIVADLQPRVLAVLASDEELSYLASVGASSVSTFAILRFARNTFLTIAFLVSFLIAELVAHRFPDSGSSLISRLAIGILAFIVQLTVLGRAGEEIERSISWQIFERRRRRLQSALGRLIEVCFRVWNEANSLIPTSC